jgi:hypothetical protein
VTLVQHATAQTTFTPVTLSAFTAKVNQLDAFLAVSDMTSAQATWLEVHTMMLSVLHKSKEDIRDATTPLDKSNHITILENQQTIYYAVWNLKTNLAVNRAAIHVKLGEFGSTIY